MEEEILVVPRELLLRVGYFQGFSPEADRYLSAFLEEGRCFFVPRSQAECDSSLKQLIPYVIFVYTDDTGVQHLFQYTRGLGQGEKRLRTKRSIGIGGHINRGDSIRKNPRAMYVEALRRELAEEVRVDTTWTERCIGLINDDQTDVGRVHLGVVHLFEVAKPAVTPAEPDIRDAAFRPVSELLADLNSFETWSQICLQAFFAPIIMRD